MFGLGFGSAFWLGEFERDLLGLGDFFSVVDELGVVEVDGSLVEEDSLDGVDMEIELELELD